MNDEFYKSVIDDSPIGFLYLEAILDSSGAPFDFKIVRVNTAFCELIGHKASEIKEKKIIELLPDISKDPDLWIKSFGDVILRKTTLAFKTGLETISGLVHVQAFSPESGYVAAFCSILSKDDGLENHSDQNKTISDDTQRKRSDELLKQEKDLFKTILLSIGDAIMATNQDGKVIVMNEVALQLTGWKIGEAIGRNCEEVFHIINEKTRKRCEPPISRVIRTGKTIALTNHTILISKDGTEYPITDSAAPIIGEKGEVKGVVLAFRDVTLEKQKVDAIRYLSYHDQLTGIFNRSFFEEEIKRLNTKRNLPISIVLADVNCLKLTNDAFGHTTGDKILKKAARIIQNCCRQDDIFARVGGDEFAILLPRTSNQDAVKIVERIKYICTKTQTQSIALSISFGIATKETNLEDIRQIQKKAEDNMYKNKLFESPEMRSRTIQSVISKLYQKYTAERRHSQRVSRLCEAIGREINLSDREINDMKNAALLHDIGKIAIKSEVLNKSTMLSDKEWSEIRRHPEVGYRLLSSLSDFSYVSECILAHHERYDGTGYPKGLKGKTIPVLPRIIALAEAFDSMTSDRAYHKAMSEDEALIELKRNSGTQFDPDLVDIFLKIHSNSQFELK